MNITQKTTREILWYGLELAHSMFPAHSTSNAACNFTHYASLLPSLKMFIRPILNSSTFIFHDINKNYSKNLIAQLLNRHISTIYREINRLSSATYSPIAAQSDASLKAKNSKKKEKFQNIDLKIYILQKLKELWSPEQISNRLKIDFPNNESI